MSKLTTKEKQHAQAVRAERQDALAFMTAKLLEIMPDSIVSVSLEVTFDDGVVGTGTMVKEGPAAEGMNEARCAVCGNLMFRQQHDPSKAFCVNRQCGKVTK